MRPSGRFSLIAEYYCRWMHDASAWSGPDFDRGRIVLGDDWRTRRIESMYHCEIDWITPCIALHRDFWSFVAHFDWYTSVADGLVPCPISVWPERTFCTPQERWLMSRWREQWWHSRRSWLPGQIVWYKRKSFHRSSRRARDTSHRICHFHDWFQWCPYRDTSTQVRTIDTTARADRDRNEWRVIDRALDEVIQWRDREWEFLEWRTGTVFTVSKQRSILQRLSHWTGSTSPFLCSLIECLLQSRAESSARWMTCSFARMRCVILTL